MSTPIRNCRHKTVYAFTSESPLLGKVQTHRHHDKQEAFRHRRSLAT